MNAGASDAVVVDLTPDEAEVLADGLRQWGGPVDASDEVARAIGFDDAATMHRDVVVLAATLAGPRPALLPGDWCRALAAVEIAFGSDVLGCGREWSTVTGLTDAHTVAVLRGVQRKLIGIRPADGL